MQGVSIVTEGQKKGCLCGWSTLTQGRGQEVRERGREVAGALVGPRVIVGTLGLILNRREAKRLGEERDPFS